MIKDVNDMKNISVVLLLSLLFLVSCSSGDSGDGSGSDDGVTLTSSPGNIEASALGGVFTLNVNCSRTVWTAFADDNSKSWIKVECSGTSSMQGMITVTIAANPGKDVRNGTIVLKSGAKRVTIPVKQVIPMQVSENRLHSLSNGETFHVTVKATGEWIVKSNDSWITAEKVGNDGVNVTTAQNPAMADRTGTVDVISGDEKLTITVTQNSAEDKDIVTPEGYRLVWHDEFNQGTELNAADWTHEVWNPGQVNNEEQAYVNHKSPSGKFVTELVDGRLHINCFKENGKIYSGRVYAKVNEGWQYGYIEARIKLPKGKGTWPAFWMMPVHFRSWPADGEIDIMEEVGVDAGWVSSTIHCNKYNNGGTSIEHGQKYLSTAESDFHVYACEWTASYMRFFVDGEPILTYRNDGSGYDAWPFDQPFYVILNLAWGGAWGGYNGTDESALPVTMEVDYVRVFQK